MPPKRTVDELIESLLEPRVIDALAKALGATIAGIVEAKLDEKFKDLFDTVKVLKADNLKINKTVADL